MVGSGDDPNKRLAMYWNDGDMTDQPPGADSIEYAYPCADDQLSDPDSLLAYVSAVNKLRLAYPAIAAGENEWVYSDEQALLMRRTLEGKSILIAVNLSFTETRQVPLPREGLSIGAALTVWDEAPSIDGETVTLPPCAIAVMEE